MDVSAFLHVRGHPTEVPRVVARLFHELLAIRGINFKLCRFSPRFPQGMELEIDLKPALAQATIRPGPAPPPGVEMGDLTSQPGLRKTTESDWKAALFYRLPRRVRPVALFAGGLVRRALGWVNVKGLIKSLSSRAAALRRFAPWPGPHGVLRLNQPVRVRVRGKPLRLGPSDIVLSLGLPWEPPGYAEMMWRLKRAQGFRLVSLTCDVLPWKFPQFYGPGFPPTFLHRVVNTLWCSDLVLTVSNSSRSDILRLAEEAGAPAPPVELVRLGDGVSPAEGGCAGETGPGEPFVLSVGTLEVRKNHLLLYQVWRKLIESHGERVPRLVIVGGKGLLADYPLFLIEHDPLTRGKVLPLGNVSDDQLIWLYQNCLFTTHASFAEGWALPVAESLSFGKYCAASNSCSAQEIAGDLIDYHDPCSVRECLDLVTRAVFDPVFRSEKEKAIRSRYRPHSWGKCTSALLGTVANRFGVPFPAKDGSDGANA
jgi:glycosyltransferase involved in cell wall biosynthesis